MADGIQDLAREVGGRATEKQSHVYLQVSYNIIDLGFIFRWISAYFVSNFIAMATNLSDVIRLPIRQNPL